MRKHIGKARYPLVVALVAVTVVLYLQIRSAQRAEARALLQVSMPASDELASALIRVGLDAEALAAAGASNTNAAAVVNDVAEHLATYQFALEQADASWASTRQFAKQLERVIQSGTATNAQVAAYPTAQSNFQSAESTRQNLLDGVFVAGIAHLSNAQQATLTTIRGNRHWGQPIEFLTINPTEPQRVELRECLANERISAESGEEPDPDAQAILAGYRSNPAISMAAASLQANLTAVTAAWNQTVNE